MIDEYFATVERRLRAFPLAVAVEMRSERVDLDRGFFKARMTCTDGSELHLFEYVVVDEGEPGRQSYRYHHQRSDGALIKRWDDAPHHPEVPTFPHHLHEGGTVRPTEPPDLETVLVEVATTIRS